MNFDFIMVRCVSLTEYVNVIVGVNFILVDMKFEFFSSQQKTGAYTAPVKFATVKY